MKDSRVKSALQAIANRGIPDDADTWPAIQSQLPEGVPSMRLRTKMSWSLAWAILALALLTTAAYALYRYLNDPGLRAAQNAGLITDMNTTAEPNVLTPPPPYSSGTGSATMVGSEQSQDGITVVLDWMYLEDSRQAFHVTVKGLGADLRLGMPQLTISGTSPEWYSGATFALEGEDTLQGTYLVHQIVRPGGQPGGRVDVQLDIPVTAWNNGQPSPAANFHFDVPDLEITVPWGGGGSNTYAVTVNGLEMRMQHVIFAPRYTQAQLCYQKAGAEHWIVDEASAQYGQPPALLPNAGVAMQTQVEVQTGPSETCRDVTFPLTAPGKDVAFYLTVDRLVQPATQDQIDSRWEFSTYLPGDLHIGGVAASDSQATSPLASQTVGDTTATLEWAYVDSNRLAFEVRFDPWQESFSVRSVAVRLPDGTELNAGAGWGPADSDPATARLDFTPVTALKMDRLKGQLVISLNTAPRPDMPAHEFVFDLDLPVYSAMTIEPMLTASANGTDVILQMVKASPSYTVVYLCYRKPSPGDWMLGDAVTLQIGADQAGINDYGMLYDPEYRDTGKGTEPGWRPAIQDGRCVRAGFPVGHHSKPEELVLTIDSLQLSAPEAEDPDEVKRALAELSKQGIEMDYMTYSGDGGGGGGPVFKHLPDGMTEAQAYRRFIEALGYVYPGPWVFRLNIKP